MINAKCIHIRCQKMQFRSKPCIILFYVKKKQKQKKKHKKNNRNQLIAGHSINELVDNVPIRIHFVN